MMQKCLKFLEQCFYLFMTFLAILGGLFIVQRGKTNDDAEVKQDDKLQEEVIKAPMSDTYKSVNKRYS